MHEIDVDPEVVRRCFLAYPFDSLDEGSRVGQQELRRDLIDYLFDPIGCGAVRMRSRCDGPEGDVHEFVGQGRSLLRPRQSAVDRDRASCEVCEPEDAFWEGTELDINAEAKSVAPRVVSLWSVCWCCGANCGVRQLAQG